MEAASLAWDTDKLDLTQDVELPFMPEDDGDDEEGSAVLTVPPIGVLVRDQRGKVDVHAGPNVTVILSAGPRHRLRNNSSRCSRGVATFYGLKITPVPSSGFHLTARATISHPEVVRYPLLRRHVSHVYPVEAGPALASKPVHLARVVPTRDELQRLVPCEAALRGGLPAAGGRADVVVVRVAAAVGPYLLPAEPRDDGALDTSARRNALLRRLVCAHRRLKQPASPLEATIAQLTFAVNSVFGSSLEAIATGAQSVVELLNPLGIDAALVGHQDVLFGLDRFAEASARCSFPWVLSNVLEDGTNDPVPGAVASVVLHVSPGVRVGVIGLVDEAWVRASSINTAFRRSASGRGASGERPAYAYRDKVGVARALTATLRQTCTVVIALTQASAYQDTVLAEATRGTIDVVCGSPDGPSMNRLVGPTRVLKPEATQPAELSYFEVTLPVSSEEASKILAFPGSAKPAPLTTAPGSEEANNLLLAFPASTRPAPPHTTIPVSEEAKSLLASPASPFTTVLASGGKVHLLRRPEAQQHTIRPGDPSDADREDPRRDAPEPSPSAPLECGAAEQPGNPPGGRDGLQPFAEAVDSCFALARCAFEAPLGVAEDGFDLAPAAVSARENAFGTWLADAVKTSLAHFSCDVVLLPASCFSPSACRPGKADAGCLLSILHAADPIVVVSSPGAAIRELVEEGLARYPEACSSFLQVAGLQMTVEASRPPGSRVAELWAASAPVGHAAPWHLLENYSSYTVAMPVSLSRHPTMARVPKVLTEAQAQPLPSMLQSYLRSEACPDSCFHPATDNRITIFE
ncbi:Trifunctional nucleotide phosphoesterase protein YfkN [Diplonema papillatum]|nr:Trifunctional nucleotide phosphoesterase protein YfkN [Diplonema papillatum]